MDLSTDAPLIPRVLFESEDAGGVGEQQHAQAPVGPADGKAGPSGLSRDAGHGAGGVAAEAQTETAAEAAVSAAVAQVAAGRQMQAVASALRAAVVTPLPSSRHALSDLSDLDDASDVLIGSLSVGGESQTYASPSSGLDEVEGPLYMRRGSQLEGHEEVPEHGESQLGDAAPAAVGRGPGQEQGVALLLPGLPLVSPRGGPSGSAAASSAVSTPRSRYETSCATEASVDSVSSSAGGGRVGSGGRDAGRRRGGTGGGGAGASLQGRKHHHNGGGGADQAVGMGNGDGEVGSDCGSGGKLMPVLSGQICDQSLRAAAAAVAQGARDRDGGLAASSSSMGDAASPEPKGSSPSARTAASPAGTRSPSAAAIAASLAAWRPPLSPERLRERAAEGGVAHRQQTGSWSGDWASGGAEGERDVAVVGKSSPALGCKPRAGSSGGCGRRDSQGRDSRGHGDDRGAEAAVSRSLPLPKVARRMRLSNGDAVAWLHTNELFEPDSSMGPASAAAPVPLTRAT